MKESHVRPLLLKPKCTTHNHGEDKTKFHKKSTKVSGIQCTIWRIINETIYQQLIWTPIGLKSMRARVVKLSYSLSSQTNAGKSRSHIKGDEENVKKY